MSIEDLKEQLDEYETKLITYSECYKKMYNVSKGLKNLKSRLMDCEKSLKNGGYILNGETLDKGKLKSVYNNTQDIIDEFDTLYNDINNKISELKSCISNTRNEIRMFNE